MSVPAYRRSLSNLQFYETGFKIYEEIVKVLDKLPKKIDETNRGYLIAYFYRSILDQINNMFTYINMANSIYCRNSNSNLNRRKKYSDEAISSCYSLISLIEMLARSYIGKVGELANISKDLNDEIALLRGWKNKTCKKD